MTPMPRFHCPSPLATGAELDLPARVARHVQVLRLQPGDGITLFHGGQGGEFDATELGAASITPLLTERSVLKLRGERADKKIAHWQAVAVAACEQCGRNRVP